MLGSFKLLFPTVESMKQKILIFAVNTQSRIPIQTPTFIYIEQIFVRKYKKINYMNFNP